MNTLKKLIQAIYSTHDSLRKRAITSANQAMTIRNWLIGCYIVEYEQKGKDRARYGDQILAELSVELGKRKMKGMSPTNLKLFRQFYFTYLQFQKSLPDISSIDLLSNKYIIGQTLSDQSLKVTHNQQHIILQTLSAKSFSDGLQPSNPRYSPSPSVLLQQLSFSHFIELLKVDESLNRAFYEIECIKGNWSVRQLRRQIETLLFERTSLSKDKKALLKKISSNMEPFTIEDTIRDPYFINFTGLDERVSYTENDLEAALLGHIQDFLLELGNGFCFECRQKRISFGNEHNRIDLVFYNRILRCHVLIDLKVRAFSHADAGQMNLYLNYFNKNIRGTTDSPPVGIILCTQKDHAKVHYATTGINHKLFVSKYMLYLPKVEELQAIIEGDRAILDKGKNRAAFVKAKQRKTTKPDRKKLQKRKNK